MWGQIPFHWGRTDSIDKKGQSNTRRYAGRLLTSFIFIRLFSFLRLTIFHQKPFRYITTIFESTAKTSIVSRKSCEIKMFCHYNFGDLLKICMLQKRGHLLFFWRQRFSKGRLWTSIEAVPGVHAYVQRSMYLMKHCSL